MIMAGRLREKPKKVKPDGKLSVLTTADIETANDGTLLDWNIAYESYYKTGQTWLQFLHECIFIFNEWNVDRVWLHYGGHFDIVGLFAQVIAGNFADLVTEHHSIMVGSCVVQLELVVKGCRRHLKFADSYRLLPKSLESLCKSFGIPGKKGVSRKYIQNMEVYRAKYPSRYHAYHKQDTLQLLEILRRYRPMVNSVSPLGNLKLTIGSTAKAIFAQSFLPCNIIVPNKQERDFTRLGFQGGRVEFFGQGDLVRGHRATYDHVKKLDQNSQYPYAMLNNPFPCVYGVLHSSDIRMRYRDGGIRPGIYRARFEQRHGSIAIIKPCVAYREVSDEAAWEGETVATYIELNEIEKHGGKIDLIEGCTYEDENMVPLFRDFIRRIYDMRMEARLRGETAMDYVLKIIMNSLYGKFGEGELSEEFELPDIETLEKYMRDPQTRIVEMDARYPLGSVRVTKPKPRVEAFPAISAFVTAHARLDILRLANDRGIRIIYCDTDSIHTQDEIPAELVSSSELGKFKLETKPSGHRMTYGTRKLYADMTETDPKKFPVKAKGVRSDMSDRERLYRAFEDGTPAGFTFRSPSSIVTAVNEGLERPNEFRERTRTLRAKPSSKEKGLLR